MNSYRFNGRIATFFRKTDNAWASRTAIAEGVNSNSKSVQSEIRILHDSGNLERRGAPRSYEYRWNPDTLHAKTIGRGDRELRHV